MDIKQLITFRTLAQEKNYMKTSEKLSYAPSTLAKHIRSLEDELQVQLVEYRNDEDSIRTALLSAQRLGDTVVREANHKAGLIMDDANVTWQTAELGKVDAGGGGTIAYLMAKYGMDVIDSGVPVLSMHAPWEIISKADLYEALKGYIAFLNA